MKTIEAYVGGAAFLGMWMLMSFAALTPVDVAPAQLETAAVAAPAGRS